MQHGYIEQIKFLFLHKLLSLFGGAWHLKKLEVFSCYMFLISMFTGAIHAVQYVCEGQRNMTAWPQHHRP